MFVDHYAHFTWLYLLKNKFDVFFTFTQFRLWLRLKSPIKFKSLDLMGVVNTPLMFLKILTSNGIICQISCLYTPQQNDLVERKHKHIVETTITFLSHAKLSYSFYSYAVSSVAYLINLLPTSTLYSQSPWFSLYGHTPDLPQLKTFGCMSPKPIKDIYSMISVLKSFIPLDMPFLMKTLFLSNHRHPLLFPSPKLLILPLLHCLISMTSYPIFSILIPPMLLPYWSNSTH